MAGDILYVDDEPDDLLAPARRAGVEERFLVLGIDDLERGADINVSSCAAWVLDFYNDEAERGRNSFGATKSNGLSLFQRLRLLAGERRPPTILVSNHLEMALDREILARRRHVLAEEVGVEWIADKGANGDEAVGEIVAISDAAIALLAESNAIASAEPQSYVQAVSDKLLRVPMAAAWAPLALSDVDDWRPPSWTDEPPQLAADRGNGAAGKGSINARPFVSWMIRQALPYPSFLINDVHVAARLKVTPQSLREALRLESPLKRALEQSRYTGILSNFDGHRWWAAGVDAFVFDLPTFRADREAKLAELAGAGRLHFLDVADAVVVSDADLIETDEIVAADVCVRASNAFAPSHAPPAWVRIDTVRGDKGLQRRVWLEDQASLMGEA